MTPIRNTNLGLLLLFSIFFPPGANYMYMGLIKRGLAAMCGFFLLIYLAVTAFFAPLAILFWFALPVFWMACFFDGLHIRKRILSGAGAEDGVGDVLNSLLKNKSLTLILLGIILLALAGNILGFAVELLRRSVPILLIALALYVVFRTKK